MGDVEPALPNERANPIQHHPLAILRREYRLHAERVTHEIPCERTPWVVEVQRLSVHLAAEHTHLVQPLHFLAALEERAKDHLVPAGDFLQKIERPQRATVVQWERGASREHENPHLASVV